jgi:hypothetical protein
MTTSSSPVFRFHTDRPERWVKVIEALFYQVADDRAVALGKYILREAKAPRKVSKTGRITIRFTRAQRALLGRALAVVRLDKRTGNA